MILKKGIATILSAATILTAVSPCAFAEGNNSEEKNTKSMSTTGKVLLGAAGAVGLAATVGIIYYAVKNSHVKVETLKGKPIYNKYMELKDAVIKNECEKVAKILNENKDLDISAWFKHCIDNGSWYTENNTLLHIAVQHERYDICKLLICRGADVNAGKEFNKTPLHLAVERGFGDICLLLINGGADVNAGSMSRFTPLHYAIVRKRSKICELLLKKGAHIHPDLFLEVADYYDDTKICELFIKHGFDIHANKTCLHEAALWGKLNVLNLLLDKGIDVNVRDNSGKTPLHKAATNSFESCKLLLEKGADINAKDNRGKTPLDCVDELNLRVKEEIRQFLIDNGAKHGNELK